MAGTPLGAIRTAAARLGISEADYSAHLAAGEKWCIACRDWQPRDGFGTDRSRGDGLKSKCLAHGVRVAAGPSKTERRAGALLGLSRCSDCCDWLAASEVLRGRCRAHRNEAYNRWYEATGGLFQRDRAASRRRDVDAVGPDTTLMLFEATAGLCSYSCGRRATGLDHVIPVARGGKTEPGNMAPACKSCNSAKRDRDPWPWICRMSEAAIDLISPGLTYDGALLDCIEAAA